MAAKLLFTIGNLYTGSPWGVEAERGFGTVEIHGPFSSENEANTYAHKLAEQPARPEGPYTSVMVIRIERALAGRRIVLKDGAYEYEEA